MFIAFPVLLRPARRDDWPTIRRWLKRQDIQDWWGPSSATAAEVLLALDSPSAMCRMISSNATGETIGYGHAIDAATWGANLPDDLAPGTWEIDLFIASEVHRGHGAGAAALSLLKAEVFETTLAVAVAVFPLIANERAVRAYEKAGFRWKRVWEDPIAGPAWFMTVEREAKV